MNLVTSIALAILGGIFAALAAFGGIRAAWRGLGRRRGAFAALAALAAACTILAQKTSISFDRLISDAGSYATNDVLHVAATNAAAYAAFDFTDSDLLVYRRKHGLTNAADWVECLPRRKYGDQPADWHVPDATNYDYLVAVDYVPPSPVLTNGVFELRGFVVPGDEPGNLEQLAAGFATSTIVDNREIVPIEYLESTGTQHIDTGIYHNYTNTVRFKIRMPTHSPSLAYLGAYADYQNEQTRTTRIIRRGTSLRNVIIYHGAIAGSQGVGVDNVVGNDYTVEGYTTNTGGVLNGVSYRATASYGVTGTSTATLKLLISNSNIAYAQTARVYYFKIDNQCDLIPVRVGRVGYMFDRVSGELFGNAGTGAFILGPDIKE